MVDGLGVAAPELLERALQYFEAVVDLFGPAGATIARYRGAMRQSLPSSQTAASSPLRG